MSGLFPPIDYRRVRPRAEDRKSHPRPLLHVLAIRRGPCRGGLDALLLGAAYRDWVGAQADDGPICHRLPPFLHVVPGTRGL